jgi:outer membrane immunogenic protein
MTFKLIKAGAAMLALFVTSFAAQAADMPIKAPYYKGPPRSVVSYHNWAGFYVGVNGGYGWGKGSLDFPATSFSPQGWLLGATAGYNHQAGSIVLGIEGDYDWSSVKGTAACGAFVCELSNPWLGTLRGRAGYAFDRWLPYLTAGAAFGRVKLTSTSPLLTVSESSKTQTGWTAGAGLEYAFTGNWSAKLEYLYVDLGSFDCSATCGGVAPNNVSFRENIVRAGLNYKFGGPLYSRY